MKKNNLIYKVRIYLLYLLIPFIVLSGFFFFYINIYLIDQSIKTLDIELKYLDVNYLDSYFKSIEDAYNNLYTITKQSLINNEENLNLLEKEFLKYKTDDMKNLYISYGENDVIVFPGKLKMKMTDFNNAKWYSETRLGNTITYTNFQNTPFNENKLVLSNSTCAFLQKK